jgi:hypothetical protein
MKNLVCFLKDPLSEGRLRPVLSTAFFIASIFVNAYFLMTSFSGLASWFMKTSGNALTMEAQQGISDIVNLTGNAFTSKLGFGLLMTVFAMLFLLAAAYLGSEKQERETWYLFERACSTLLVPMLFMLASALLMNISFIAGVVFATLAVSACAAVIVEAGRKANLNGYLTVVLVTGFILITAVLCTNNHFVTMF